jgi:hypothetical protein
MLQTAISRRFRRSASRSPSGPVADPGLGRRVHFPSNLRGGRSTARSSNPRPSRRAPAIHPRHLLGRGVGLWRARVQARHGQNPASGRGACTGGAHGRCGGSPRPQGRRVGATGREHPIAVKPAPSSPAVHYALASRSGRRHFRTAPPRLGRESSPVQPAQPVRETANRQSTPPGGWRERLGLASRGTGRSRRKGAIHRPATGTMRGSAPPRRRHRR